MRDLRLSTAHPRALQFHHLDPEQQVVRASLQRASRGSLAETARGGAKCVLLCANCHAEVEAGVTATALELTVASSPGSDLGDARLRNPG